MSEDILIVGGYGEVGRRVATILEVWNPGRVIVAGRRPPGDSALRTRTIDLDDRATIAPALDGVSTVIACVRQREPHLLDEAARLGLAYTSIAAPWMPWDTLDPLRQRARESGARLLLATGLEPGISSVLARVGAERVGRVDAIETALLLSVGDAYGADSMAFLVEELAQTYAIMIDGRSVTAHGFERPKQFAFPEPLGERRAYTIPFRDQLYYPFTLGAQTAIARIALDPPWIAALLARAAKLGARRLVGREGGRTALHGITERLRRRYAGHDQYALVVEVRGTDGVARSTLVGHRQAHATAVSAAATAQALIAREIATAGVYLAEQVLEPAAFLARLAEHRLQVATEFHPQSTTR